MVLTTRKSLEGVDMMGVLGVGDDDVVVSSASEAADRKAGWRI